MEAPTSPTWPQHVQFNALANNKNISYTHQLILHLPKHLQDSAWKINTRIKLFFHLIDIALVTVTSIKLGVIPSLPYLIGGLAVGSAIRFMSVTWLNPLKTDDKAWILIATTIVSFVTGFPIGIACGALFFCLVPSKKKPQPENHQEKEHQAVEKLFQTHKHHPEQLAEFIKGIQNKPTCFDQFVVALEAYIKIVATLDNVEKEEIFEFLYGKEGVMNTYTDNKGDRVEPPFLKNTVDKDGNVVLYTGTHKHEIGYNSVGYKYVNFTLIFSHVPNKGSELVSPWYQEGEQLLSSGVDPYFYAMNSSAGKSDMQLKIQNQTKRTLLVSFESFGGLVHLDPIAHGKELNIKMSELLTEIDPPVELVVREYKILGK